MLESGIHFLQPLLLKATPRLSKLENDLTTLPIKTYYTIVDQTHISLLLQDIIMVLGDRTACLDWITPAQFRGNGFILLNA
jgi:hypothetical protein